LELKTFAFNPAAPSEETATQAGVVAPVSARVKVLNPVSSTGPSMPAQILSFSRSGFQIRVPRCILVGSTVQVRTREKIAFGEVRSSIPAGAEFEIGVEVQRSS
jgi:hypothetical protein